MSSSATQIRLLDVSSNWGAHPVTENSVMDV